MLIITNTLFEKIARLRKGGGMQSLSIALQNAQNGKLTWKQIANRPMR